MILALPFMSCMILGKSLTIWALAFSTMKATCVMVKVMDFGNGLWV